MIRNVALLGTLCLLGAALGGCGDSSLAGGIVTPAARFPDPTASFSIADGANGGNTRFYFLPPLVDNPKIGPENDNTILPALSVEVCVLAGTTCAPGAPLARMVPSTSGQEKDDGLRLDGNHYAAEWQSLRTASTAVDYRITVFAGAAELGHADVDLQGKDVKKVVRPGYVRVEAGEKLRIQFRVLEGIVQSLSLSPASVSLSPGGTSVLTATAVDYQGKSVTGRTILWYSSNPSVATVSTTGVVTAIGSGTATITAWIEGVTATASVTVRTAVSSIAVTPSPSAAIVVGGTGVLTLAELDGTGAPVATPAPALWTSSDPARVTVVPDANTLSATITGVQPGSATITVSIPGTQLTKTVAVTIMAPPMAVVAGEQTQLHASDLLGLVPVSNVTWVSSDPAVMSVDANGLVTPLGVGTVTISVFTTVSGIVVSGAVTLTAQLPGWCVIRPEIAILPRAFQVLLPGQTGVQLSAALPLPSGATGLTWVSGVQSTDPPFDLSNAGLVTARHAGFGTVNVNGVGTAKYGTGCISVISAAPAAGPVPVAVRIGSLPSVLTISPQGVPQSVTVTAEFLDASGAVIPGSFDFRWASGNPYVALSSITGTSITITAVSAGSASVNASSTLPGVNLTTHVDVTVVDQRLPPPGPGAITITPSALLTLAKGQTAQLSVTVPNGTPNPGDIIWSTGSTYLSIVGSTTGSTITVQNNGTTPRVYDATVNVTVILNNQRAYATKIVTVQ